MFCFITPEKVEQSVSAQALADLFPEDYESNDYEERGSRSEKSDQLPFSRQSYLNKQQDLDVDRGKIVFTDYSECIIINGDEAVRSLALKSVKLSF